MEKPMIKSSTYLQFLSLNNEVLQKAIKAHVDSIDQNYLENIFQRLDFNNKVVFSAIKYLVKNLKK